MLLLNFGMFAISDCPFILFVSELLQIATVITSLVSISWAVVSYRRMRRLLYKEKTTIPGLVIEFLWFLFVIGVRVLAIALFTSRFQVWLLAVVAIHCVVTVTLMITSNTVKFGEDEVGLLGLMFLVPVNTLCVFVFGEQHTRLRYAIYHCIMYTENVVMAVLWYSATYTQDLWYHIPCMAIILFGYIVGVIFQVIFYLKFHPPKEEIKCCVPCNDLQFKVQLKVG